MKMNIQTVLKYPPLLSIYPKEITRGHEWVRGNHLVVEVRDHSCPQASSKTAENSLPQLLHNYIHPSWLLHHPLQLFPCGETARIHAGDHCSVFKVLL